MAELDYAFLAEYARVEANGCLTAVGASFTFVHVRSLPTTHRMAVAGRIRAHFDEGNVPFRVEIEGPAETIKLGFGGELQLGPAVQPYRDGLVGHIFALDVQVPVLASGLYVVNVFVSDVHARRLAFEVAVQNPDA